MKTHLLFLLIFLASVLSVYTTTPPSTVTKEKRDAYSSSAYPSSFPGMITNGYSYLYVAPFICGVVPSATAETRYAAGTYLTSIDVLALADTQLNMQLSLNFPPSTQFEPGVLTSFMQLNLNRRNSFTLDCSELQNPSSFPTPVSPTVTATTYISGYAIIESQQPLVIFDFISSNLITGTPPDVTIGDPEIEILEIKAIHLPSYSNYGYGTGSYGSQGSYGTGTGSYSQGSGQGQAYNPYGSGLGTGSYGSQGSGQGQIYNPYGSGLGTGSYGSQGSGLGQIYNPYGSGQGSYNLPGTGAGQIYSTPGQGLGSGPNYFGQGQGLGNPYGQGQGIYGQGQGLGNPYGQGLGNPYGQGQGLQTPYK